MKEKEYRYVPLAYLNKLVCFYLFALYPALSKRLRATIKANSPWKGDPKQHTKTEEFLTSPLPLNHYLPAQTPREVNPPTHPTHAS